MSDLSVPLAGISNAEASLNRAASRIAQAGFAGSGASGVSDTIDLSAEMIALLEARNDFAANVKVAQVEDRINQSLVNLLG